MEEWSTMPFISYGEVDVAKMYTGMYQACPGPVTSLLSKYRHVALGCKVTNLSFILKNHFPSYSFPTQYPMNLCAQLVFPFSYTIIPVSLQSYRRMTLGHFLWFSHLHKIRK